MSRVFSGRFKAILAGEAVLALALGLALGPTAWDYGWQQAKRLVDITVGPGTGSEAGSDSAGGVSSSGVSGRGAGAGRGAGDGAGSNAGESRGGVSGPAAQKPPAKLPHIAEKQAGAAHLAKSTIPDILAVARARKITKILAIDVTPEYTGIDGMHAAGKGGRKGGQQNGRKGSHKASQKVSIRVEVNQRITYHELGSGPSADKPLQHKKAVAKLSVPRLIAHARKDLHSKAAFSTLDIRYDSLASTDVARVYLGRGATSKVVVYRVTDMKKLYAG